jgi:hypothetical protein
MLFSLVNIKLTPCLFLNDYKSKITSSHIWVNMVYYGNG